MPAGSRRRGMAMSAIRETTAAGTGCPGGRPADAPPCASPHPADLTIDCDTCTMQGTSACDDCVVSFLLWHDPDDAVVIDADEARAMRMLEQAGLLPSLRFASRAV